MTNLNPKKALIIGYGSIGQRHAEVLSEMGLDLAVISQHAQEISFPLFTSLQKALSLFKPDYVVVANRTSEHIETLNRLDSLDFKGICLVEKPLSTNPLPTNWAPSFQIKVGYVLRFHPLIQKAMQILKGKRLLSIHSYVGQYLPNWRPNTDYRTCYSAIKEQGGGALRDLSHELDYISLLAGAWEKVSALGGHFSDLEINTDDVYGLLLKSKHCSVVLCQLNYLDHNLRRDCSIQYDGGTLYLNLIENKIIHNTIESSVELERNDIFKNMHKSILSEKEESCACSFKEAIQTVELINAAEKSVEKGTWICQKNQ